MNKPNDKIGINEIMKRAQEMQKNCKTSKSKFLKWKLSANQAVA